MNRLVTAPAGAGLMQTVGRIDSTSWRTGQPSLDVNVIACTHIQVVYSGVNITSPSTCAQANFS